MEKLLKHDKARNYIPVYYDTWSNDNDTDPILSIIFKILQDVDDLEDYEAHDKSWRDIFVTAVEATVTAFGGTQILLTRPNKTFSQGINANATDVVSLAGKFQPVYECIFGNSIQPARVSGDTIEPDDKKTDYQCSQFHEGGAKQWH